MKCQKCGKEYEGKFCPNCGKKAKVPISKGRQIAGIIVLIFGVSILFSAAINWKDNPNDSISSSESTSEQSETINRVTYENFSKIQTGMTYGQVVEIFGVEGKILSQVDIGSKEYETIIYGWYDDTGIANCNVTIQGGKVISKAQMGLK